MENEFTSLLVSELRLARSFCALVTSSILPQMSGRPAVTQVVNNIIVKKNGNTQTNPNNDPSLYIVITIMMGQPPELSRLRYNAVAGLSGRDERTWDVLAWSRRKFGHSYENFAASSQFIAQIWKEGGT